jgi:hypothetical protein
MKIEVITMNQTEPGRDIIVKENQIVNQVAAKLKTIGGGSDENNPILKGAKVDKVPYMNLPGVD